MGKTKTKSRSGSGKDILHGTSAHFKSPGKPKGHTKSTEDLLTEAATLLEQSQPDLALPLVEQALLRLEAERENYASIDTLLKQSAASQPTYPEALVLGADTYLALGGIDEARTMFEKATSIDPDGALISAEPWLWLAQLCEEGGQQSIEYFERAIEVLRNEAEVLEEGLQDMTDEDKLQGQLIMDEKRTKLANALCGMAEVYMTDLSWEDDAEIRCEGFVTEAIAVCPERLSAGALQTLASVRISQERTDDARKALALSMTLWKDIPEEIEDPAKPDFATRVSLARLLMEVEAESEAMTVLEGLIKEDDQSVECVYLAGWCQFILSQKKETTEDDRHKHEGQARVWLGTCLKLYQLQDYEDDRLKDHALELISKLNAALGITADDDEWEDEEEDIIEDNEELEQDDSDVEMT